MQFILPEDNRRAFFPLSFRRFSAGVAGNVGDDATSTTFIYSDREHIVSGGEFRNKAVRHRHPEAVS